MDDNCSQQDFPSFRRGMVTAWLILGVSLAITGLAWRFADANSERLARERFEFRTAEIRSAIDKRMQAYEQVLRGAVGLLAASGEVTRQEWRTYVDQLAIHEHYPGILVVGFVRRVRHDELETHVAQVRAEGFADYDVWPQGRRDEYYPTVFLDPFNRRNRRAFGYDTFSEPIRRAAMEQARDAGTTAVSGRIILVQDADLEAQASFLMFLPVYDQARPSTTPAERRAALQGYVLGGFRMEDLMRGILGARAPDLRLQIYDGRDRVASSLMYDSGPQPPAQGSARFSETLSLQIMGRTWTLRLTSLSGFEASPDRLTPLLLLVTLIFISLLLFALAWSLANTRQRALAMANRMTAAIKDSETRLREITATLGEGVYVQDEQGRITFVNPEAEALLGWSEAELLGQDAHRLIHRHDGDRAEPALVHADCPLIHAIQAKARFQADEDAFWRKDGSMLAVSVIASPIVRGDEPAGSVVAFRDISERKAAESALRDSHRFRLLFEYARDALFLIEANGRIVDANRLACESLGYLRDALIGAFLDKFTRNTTVAGKTTSFLRLLERVHHQDSVLMEAEYLRRDGSRFLGEAMFSLFEYEGRDLIMAAVRDTTQRKLAEEELKRTLEKLEQAKLEADNANLRLARANQQLQRISQIDGLTGVANRRFFDQYLAREWKRAARTSHPLAIILADVDHFKKYNDHYGHQAGDDCLMKVAKALQGVVNRPADLLARYGGEEFVAILPETGANGAFHIAENMRRAVAALNIPHANSTTVAHVSLSLGVAAVSPDEHPIVEHLIAAADKALYAAKAEGRNTVRLGEIAF